MGSEADWHLAHRAMERSFAAQAAAAGQEIILMQHKAYSGFLGSMKIALFGGIVLASPVILYQLWSFVGAGLYRHERKAVKYYATPGFFLFF